MKIAEPQDWSDSIVVIPEYHYGAKIYGGFAGAEQSVEDRDLSLNETIISADINGDYVYYAGDQRL